MPSFTSSPRTTRTTANAAAVMNVPSATIPGRGTAQPTQAGQNSVPATPTKPRFRADRPAHRIDFIERQQWKEGEHHRRWMCGLVKGLDIVKTEFEAGYPRRDLVWKESATRCHISGLDDQKKLAILAQLGGQESPVPCDPCSCGNPFVGCVSSTVVGHGACAGCKWGSNAGRCNYRQKVASLRKAAAHKQGFRTGVAAMSGHQWVTLPEGYRGWSEETWRAYRTELEKAMSVAGMHLAGLEEEQGWYD
ncbi:hypothetical protein KEM55_002918 [Ascosphaera atra]|nr:hypothetical protein KEM55_002918 [Ascosphaera atra]